MSVTDLLVSKIQRARLQIPRNRYTDKEERGEYWKLTFRFAHLPDRSIDLWFPDEPDARQVGEKGVVTLAEVFRLMAPLNEEFVTTGTAQDQKYVVPNRYTDATSRKPSWHTMLWCQATGRYADLWYGDERKEAEMWAANRVYGPLDFLRTFRILVLFYPAAEYVAEISLGGFIDEHGYHRPGVYPHGFYPAGFEIGGSINLEVTTAKSLGHFGFLSVQAAQALSRRFGIPLLQWIVVVFG